MPPAPGSSGGERPSASGGPPQAPAPRRPRHSRCEGAVSAVRRNAARRMARQDGWPPPRGGWGWNTRSAPAAGPGRRREVECT
jgi:hypothetical protein